MRPVSITAPSPRTSNRNRMLPTTNPIQTVPATEIQHLREEYCRKLACLGIYKSVDAFSGRVSRFWTDSCCIFGNFRLSSERQITRYRPRFSSTNDSDVSRGRSGKSSGTHIGRRQLRNLCDKEKRRHCRKKSQPPSFSNWILPYQVTRGSPR